MNSEASACPFKDNVDRRKSAPLAIAKTQPAEGSHWIKQGKVARAILRNAEAIQAGAGAEFFQYENPEHAPVFFLEGVDHHRKRMKTQKFLSPKAVAEQHHQVMRRETKRILDEFQQRGKSKLEDMSFELAVEVVSDILGLTNSNSSARAKRIIRVLNSTLNQDSSGLSGKIRMGMRAFHAMNFFIRDVKPAMKARRTAPKNDAISFYLEEGYSNEAIIAECLTYGTAGMMTTREFIVMAAWYLFEDPGLCQSYLDSDEKGQLAILLEILRLEPVAAMVQRRVHDEIEAGDGEKLPSGGLYGIDIRASNVDEALVGECPFALDPERATRQKENGRFLSFSDGPHNCPGWQVAMHETRIFLDQLFRLPNLKLEREPDMTWNEGVKGYELRNAWISCN